MLTAADYHDVAEIDAGDLTARNLGTVIRVTTTDVTRPKLDTGTTRATWKGDNLNYEVDRRITTTYVGVLQNIEYRRPAGVVLTLGGSDVDHRVEVKVDVRAVVDIMARTPSDERDDEADD